MRITLTITQLEGGGAERVMVLLAQGLLQRGHAVTVVTLSSRATDFYTLPPAVQRFDLNLKQKSPTVLHGIFNTVLRLVHLRKAIHASQPNIVVSFMAFMNIFTAIALLNTPYPIVGTQHCNPRMLPIGLPWELFRRFAYRRLTRLVSVSQGVDDEFDWLPEAQRAVIYNPFLPIDRFQAMLDYPQGVHPDRKWIVAMGRLTAAKRFDRLLTAFQQIADQHPDWQLLILGEGELRSELETLRDRLGLTEQAVFTGKIGNPFPLLQHAQLFVLSSQTEGFPMALGEALACGIPAIATDCSQGIRELMRDGIDGIVVPNGDQAALAAAMSHLMSDDAKRKQFASRAPEVIERFSLDRIIDRWEELFAEVLQEAQKPSEIKRSSLSLG
ncbi:glycosyltransferase family 4 protein [Leptolyngbya ohadii]|uniref:glycosyltransferase family 4 protein n=1 Tax=Leptolyngbya ohadii TaxID=1962290 RepID=UPI000B59D7EF|nr:glycosyltransferase family 4 protein [Leptolyngbya ohadii]